MDPQMDGFDEVIQKNPRHPHCLLWMDRTDWAGSDTSRQGYEGSGMHFCPSSAQQGCMILQSCLSPDTSVSKPRDLVIARIGTILRTRVSRARFRAGPLSAPVPARRLSPEGGGHEAILSSKDVGPQGSGRRPFIHYGDLTAEKKIGRCQQTSPLPCPDAGLSSSSNGTFLCQQQADECIGLTIRNLPSSQSL
ncbi:hypothetical protein SDJN02_15750, partial [Cucurbita argyrosperma subsp. argyrosperma]